MKKNIRWLLMALTGVAIILVWVLFNSNTENIYDMSRVVNHIVVEEEVPWNLVLVNKWNLLDESFNVKLKQSHGVAVDERIIEDLDRMINEAQNDGIYLIITAGYRTFQEQSEIYESLIEELIAEGNLRNKAEKYARQWQTPPGESEHQLGLGVDFTGDEIHTTDEQALEWLNANSYMYGFILRYPMDKERVMGTTYDAWHYRYVGIDTAKQMYDEGICFEEYIEKYVVKKK